MCTYSYAIAERAREDGMDRLNRLNLWLISENRFEDLKKAAEDREYQEKLYKELEDKLG